MGKRDLKSNPEYAGTEVGAIRKGWRGRTRIVLVYPNCYTVGSANLGFQKVYRVLNAMAGVVCERAFLPDGPGQTTAGIRSLESNRPLIDFDIIAFSVAFEADYLHLLTILRDAGLPVRTAQRGQPHPLVIAGGVACFLNPEPIAPFIDCVLIGEAEVLLPPFMEVFTPRQERRKLLADLAREVPGAYVPACYGPAYDATGTLSAFRARDDAPRVVRRAILDDLSQDETCTTVWSPQGAFDDAFLIEVGRGCPHGCRFCSAGFIYRPPRFRSPQILTRSLEAGRRVSGRIGLVGAAVSDLPHLDTVCRAAHAMGLRLSFSSLRADALTPELLDAMKHSAVKTATIAPDAGSERMRRVINKGLTEAQILDAADKIVAHGIPNLKLYFMIGLPTETDEDVAAIVELCRGIKRRFLKASRPMGRMGTITVNVNTFVPKPFTPFQWVPMAPVQTLKHKIKILRQALRSVPNLRVHADDPRKAYVQAVLSRGDRRVADLLASAVDLGGNWNQALKATPLDTDFFARRQRPLDERLPWDFIDHGITKSFLAREYARAMQGRSSPDCPLSNCQTCGVCGTDDLMGDPGCGTARDA